MYEDQTFEVILEKMLARIDTDIDKTEGSLIYNALAPEAWELARAYTAIDHVYDSTFADTAPREELIRRAKERGLEPKAATNAILKGEFNIDIPIGSRFSLDELTYVTTEKISDDAMKYYKMKCETVGKVGNRKFGTLIPIEYIDGLTTAVLIEVLIPAIDDEDTEEFRKRYFASFDSQAFGGNIADYISKTEAINGVGGAKYIRATKEDSHIKIQIIGSDYGVPSSELVNYVQTLLDPTQNQGEGVGIAPIGHIVDVSGCVSSIVNISATFTFSGGYTFTSVVNYINSAIDNYFLELSKSWSKSNNLIIRISQIESKLIAIEGIEDISNTSINGSKENLILDSNTIPVRGAVSAD